MSSVMMMDRNAMMGGMQQMGMPSGGVMPGMGMPMQSPTAANMCMVPRCTIKMEKCAGGMKIHCKCDDEMACAMVQNLCRMMAEGMCSCACMMNGMVMCQCNLAMCNCQVEMTKDGCCITCTTGDKACCEMVQACCDCMNACMKAGCMCCVSLGGMPCACGCCE